MIISHTCIFSCIQLFATLWTIACQAPWNGIFQARTLEWLPFLPPRDLPDEGIKPISPDLQAVFTAEPSGKAEDDIMVSVTVILGHDC